jgi:hypothetical protein
MSNAAADPAVVTADVEAERVGMAAPAPAPAPAATLAPVSPLRAAWAEFRENRIALGALAVVVLIVAVAGLAPWITPQNPYDIGNLNLLDARRPPGYVGSGGYTHWLGTDASGRDLLSAILYGLRISMQMGLMAGVVGLVLGTTLGITAAYVGGKIETAIMRIVDLQLSFPAILWRSCSRRCLARARSSSSRRSWRPSTPTSRARPTARPRPSGARITWKRRLPCP